MNKVKATTFGVLFALGALAACGKKDDPPPTSPTNPPGSAWGQPGQPPPPGYGQQPGYPQQQPGYPPQQPGYPPPQPTGAPMPGQLAVPGPAALPCSNDSMCMTHKCNVQYGKCAFPCESDNDCIQGAYCFKSAVSACLPKAPGQ